MEGSSHYSSTASYPSLVNSMVPIINPHFCRSYPVDLNIVRKVMTLAYGNFSVTDTNGSMMFKVKTKFLSFHDKRVLVDDAGLPIATLRKKLMTAHERWEVFRGESTEHSDLLFTAKRSSMFQFKTQLGVFLANNIKEDFCDFKVKGSWSKKSCIVYAGESSNIVAQMHKKTTVGSVLIGKDNFMVTVYPNIDFAFIVTLIVILDEINTVSQVISQVIVPQII